MVFFLTSVLTILLILIFISFQFFLSGKFLLWFFNKVSKGRYKIHWEGGGLHFPWLYFRIHKFRIFFPGINNTDIIDITAKEIRGRVSFRNLIIGRILVRQCDIIELKSSYINRQPSEQKVELLPKRKLVVLNNTNIEKGELYIEDHNLTPIYKILLSEIFVTNLNMDCGCPMSFLFQSEYGRCKLGEKGRLFVEKSNDSKGNITLTGATWTDLAGLKVIPVPILNDRIDLQAKFENDYLSDVVNVRGTLKNSESGDQYAQELLTSVESEDTKAKASSFQLQINWTEYALPFDLALKKLLLEIFDKLKIKGVVGFTIHTVTKGIVNIFTRG